jgi:hypothetical protein
MPSQPTVPPKSEGFSQSGSESELPRPKNRLDTVRSDKKAAHSLSHSLKREQERDFIPKILVKSDYEIYVLSYRVNGIEVLWHWEGNWLIPEDAGLGEGENEVTLLLLEDGRRLWEMESWLFFIR